MCLNKRRSSCPPSYSKWCLSLPVFEICNNNPHCNQQTIGNRREYYISPPSNYYRHYCYLWDHSWKYCTYRPVDLTGSVRLKSGNFNSCFKFIWNKSYGYRNLLGDLKLLSLHSLQSEILQNMQNLAKSKELQHHTMWNSCLQVEKPLFPVNNHEVLELHRWREEHNKFIMQNKIIKRIYESYRVYLE